MLCAKCGKENPDGAMFCKNCGAPLAKKDPITIESSKTENILSKQQELGRQVPNFEASNASSAAIHASGTLTEHHRSKKHMILIITICAIVLSVAAVYFVQEEAQKKATDDYNVEVSRIKEQEDQLETAINTAELLLASNEVPLDTQKISDLQSSIADGKSAIQDIPTLPSGTDDINKLVTNTLSKIDYLIITKEVTDKTDSLKTSIEQYKQVNNPSEEFVIQRLKRVEGIIDISAATEDNDPNGHLGEVGGYVSQVFFSDEMVDQSQVKGATLNNRGTAAGGSIEVYETAEYAKKRLDYLASFDNTELATGSHSMIGTILVRTSVRLSASEQQDLEQRIIYELTKIE
jgi:hypothetical protein